ncbi:MAG: hypothetical protein KF785_13315 [Gemmatimonadales bacterium]|nr:hypothetical protein [Gemmatimonadales bacterium]
MIRRWRRAAEALLPELFSDKRKHRLSDFCFELVLAVRAAGPESELFLRAGAFAAYCYHPDRHRSIRKAVVEDYLRHLAADPTLRLALAAYFVDDHHRLGPALFAVLPSDAFADWEAAVAAVGPPRTQWSEADLEAIGGHAGAHEQRVRASPIVGCYHCVTLFPPDDITEWIPSLRAGVQRTAICPHCGIDAILPADVPGGALTLPLLAALEAHGFGDLGPTAI